jgi:NAD(P)H-dependent flavin oxidoreductase YrpB (nitropropane dioxygenase family)
MKKRADPSLLSSLSPLFLLHPFHSSPAPIDILYEIRQEHPELLDDPHFDVIIDGGIRRGTDVLKAICLGATAVGLGRTFLYAQSCYGEAGVRKAIQSELYSAFDSSTTSWNCWTRIA